jgi:GT2 family glycosyltransferase
MSLTPTRHATVATIVVADGEGGFEDTLTGVGSQVYECGDVLVVGGTQSDASTFDTLTEAIDAVERSAEYLWVVREGAFPSPDTLGALVRDADRTGAGVTGSKIVAADGQLISVGLITDAFVVPYTGLDASERDQGQYDVVRDVAAVSGVSVLIRRDLLNGLGGVDSSLAPLGAAIDISQRAHLKGARVVVAPASEVVFEKPQAATSRWREEASRIRSYLKVYGLLTLLWVIPVDFVIGIVEAIWAIFFGRWYVVDFVRSWGWNLIKLPSTIGARRRARDQKVAGDAELFRFQRRGSVKLSVLGHGTMAAVRRRLPGDDTLTVESIGRDIRQPAFVVGLLAVVFVLLSARTIWSDGLPAVGYTLPFPLKGWDALVGYAGGWNPAGLGSPDILRPLVALAGVAKVATFDSAHLAEYVLGAGAMLLGIWGMMRLLRTWSISAAPGLIAGVVYVAGPAAQGVAGNTHLGTLLGLGLLPWALRLSLAPVREGWRPGLARLASVVLVFGLMGAAAPLLLLVPLPAVLIYAVMRFNDANTWRGEIIALVGTAGGALLLSPWIWENSFEAIIRSGYAFWDVSIVFIVAGAVIVVGSVLAAPKRLGVVAGWGALLSGFGFFVSRAGSFGVGYEAESAGLVVAGLGLAITIGVVAYSVSLQEIESWRRFVAGVASVAVVFFLVAASVIVLGGRLGLPGDQYKEALAFTRANEGEAERSRVLLVGPSDLMPGDSREIQGGAYRVVSAPVPDLGEPRLAPRGSLDDDLLASLGLIITGDTRRAGAELAPYGIRWIVILGDSDGADADAASVVWRDVFAGQLDLLPLSAGVANAVFVTDIDPVGRALTTTANSWARDGWTYRGEAEPAGKVFVADNANPSFGPPPWLATASANEVSAGRGVVTYTADGAQRSQALGVAAAVIILLGVYLWARRRV